MRRYVLTVLPSAFPAADCSPPTPASEIDGYRTNVLGHRNNLAAIVNGLGPNSLQMGSFAGALSAYIKYVQGIPTSFCIGPSNQPSFNALNAAINEASATAQRGISTFESNTDRFSASATPLLQELLSASQAITSSSRDFTPVLNRLRLYRAFAEGYSVELWGLSPRIVATASALDDLINRADQALTRSLAQIETNVESESGTIVQQATNAEAAFAHWRDVDGKVGYKKFIDSAHFTSQVLVPNFNAFLHRVPSTRRIQDAVGKAQAAVTYINHNVDSFPVFRPLPSPSNTFHYKSYGSDDRKYGQEKILAALQAVCNSHFTDTGNYLYIGDMQYEHGGKASPHASHREGRDADVDAIEVGNVPEHNKELALAAAKRILSAGAELVFYADQGIVDDANRWAEHNGIAGRLQVQADHTNHFHLRVFP